MNPSQDNDAFQRAMLDRLTGIEQRQREVSEQLAEFDKMLQQLCTAHLGAPMAVKKDAPSQAPQTPESLQEALCEWYNSLWENDATREEVFTQIRRRISGEPSARVIWFLDSTLYASDRSYAEYTDDPDGRAFVIKCAAHEDGTALFAVLPYPSVDLWFDRGVKLLERISIINGDRQSFAPKVQIVKLALLPAGPSEETGQMVYRNHRAGVMNLSLGNVVAKE